MSPQLPISEIHTNSSNCPTIFDNHSRLSSTPVPGHKSVVDCLSASRRCELCGIDHTHENAKQNPHDAPYSKTRQLLSRKQRRPKIQTKKTLQSRTNSNKTSSTASPSYTIASGLNREKSPAKRLPISEADSSRTEDEREDGFNASKKLKKTRPSGASFSPSLFINSSQDRNIPRELEYSYSELQGETSTPHNSGHESRAVGMSQEHFGKHVSVTNGGTGIPRAFSPALHVENLSKRLEDKTIRYSAQDVLDKLRDLEVNRPRNTGSCSEGQNGPQFAVDNMLRTTISVGNEVTRSVKDDWTPQLPVGNDNCMILLNTPKIMKSVPRAPGEIERDFSTSCAESDQSAATKDSLGVMHSNPSLRSRPVAPGGRGHKDTLREDIAVTLPLPRVQAKHKPDAGFYNESFLDSFLYAKPVTKKSTLTEVADKMHWTHLSPRHKWPEVRDEGWFERKQAEIKVRGGRKAQFGMVITAEIFKERREKGWEKHQNKPLSVSNRFFDPPGMPEKVEPILVNGKLAMADATPDAKGPESRRIWMVER